MAFDTRNRRTRVITLRLSDEEDQLLQQCSAETKESVSDYVRKAIYWRVNYQKDKKESTA